MTGEGVSPMSSFLPSGRSCMCRDFRIFKTPINTTGLLQTPVRVKFVSIRLMVRLSRCTIQPPTAVGFWVMHGPHFPFAFVSRAPFDS